MKLKLLAIAILLGFLLKVNATTNELFVAKRGVIDLGYSDILSSGSIKLQGECEFYWNKLLEPSDFYDSKKILTPDFITIPKSWTAYKVNGNKLSNIGYATYRILIKKKVDQEKTFYGLKVSTVFSSYKIWVNGKLISVVGKVGTTKETSSPAFKYQDIPFVLDPAEGATDRIEIIIQVSNFSHQRSGLHFPIYVGSYQSIANDTRWMDILNLIIIGIILVIGINHLSLYLFRKEDKSNLYFGIICLVMILRNVSTGDRIITYLFSNLNWELLIKLDNISGFATIPLFALFIYTLFSIDFPKIQKNIFVAIGLVVTALVIFTPAIFYGKFRTIFELYILTGGLYLTYGILLKSSIRKRPYAIQTFIGMVILYSTAINDVLSSMGIINTAYIAPYGLVTFMLIQSITINKKSAKAISGNEELSRQLTNEKENLEIKIEERTRELTLQHEILISHQEKEKLQNWVNEGVAKLNDVLSKNKDDYKQLCSNVLSALLKYIDAKMGALYVLNSDSKDNPYLELVADYGLSKEFKSQNAMIQTNSGLIGASFTENEVQLITNLPDEYFKINSGLGKSQPGSIMIVPLTFDNIVFGVIELAGFKVFSSNEVDFVKNVAYSVANNLNTVKMNERNLKLIQQFKEHSNNMKENEQRMQQNLEELEYIREQYELLKRSKVSENEL